ncbi:MAG: regulatory protein RecX [Pseudomonadota bacterium]
MAPSRPASLKVRALQWLAQREHSRSELRDKLLRLLQRSGRAEGGDDATQADGGSPAAEVETVLVWLEQNGHLCDARFTESRVHARQSRFGNRRIQQELRQHGVALDAVAQQALVQSEFSRACEVWRRKYGAPAVDAAARLRQMRFLAGRGFSMDVVQQVLKRGAPDAEDSGRGTGSA